MAEEEAADYSITSYVSDTEFRFVDAVYVWDNVDPMVYMEFLQTGPDRDAQNLRGITRIVMQPNVADALVERLAALRKL